MATQFLQILESALRHKGRISPEEFKTLEQAAQSIQGVQRQSAHDIVAMLRHDREFDAFEVGPMKQAVGVLLGADDEVLDHALKETWRRAIPGANVSIKHYSLDFDRPKTRHCLCHRRTFAGVCHWSLCCEWVSAIRSRAI